MPNVLVVFKKDSQYAAKNGVDGHVFNDVIPGHLHGGSIAIYRGAETIFESSEVAYYEVVD